MTSIKKTTLSTFLSHVLSLLVVFLLLAATAVWTGKLFDHEIGQASARSTQEKGELNMPSEEQLEALQLNVKGVSLTPRDSASWTVTSNDSHEALGIIIHSAPYAKDVEGFAGTTPLYIYIGSDEKVKAIAADDNAETPGFFKRAWEGIVNKWIGQTTEKALVMKVDAVSGATYSSKAIIANVQASLAAYITSQQTQIATPTIGWPRTVATIIALLFGFIVSLLTIKRKKSPKSLKVLRICVLLLNIGVLGFWCGQFLSVSLLRGWISSGLDPIAWLPTIIILLLAILMPFFGRKHYYCTWVCPYGGLQELTSMLPLPKIKVSAKVARWMSYVRIGVLAILLFLLWAGLGANVLNYEPFTAFMLNSAPTAVIILASIFVVANMFVPRLWCRAICPMGQLLDLSEK